MNRYMKLKQFLIIEVNDDDNNSFVRKTS